MQLAVYTTIITVTAMADAERVEEEEGLPVSCHYSQMLASLAGTCQCHLSISEAHHTTHIETQSY
jgi:hypothetical protein